MVKKSNFGEGQVQYNVTAENGKLIFNNKSYENYNYKNNVYVGDAWVSVPFKVPGSVIKSGDVPSLEINGYKASHVSFTLNKDKNGGYINYQTPPIEINNGKPKWILSNCQFCFACVQWCPKEAIEYKKTSQGVKRYRNPYIKVNELFNN